MNERTVEATITVSHNDLFDILRDYEESGYNAAQPGSIRVRIRRQSISYHEYYELLDVSPLHGDQILLLQSTRSRDTILIRLEPMTRSITPSDAIFQPDSQANHNWQQQRRAVYGALYGTIPVT